MAFRNIRIPAALFGLTFLLGTGVPLTLATSRSGTQMPIAEMPIAAIAVTSASVNAAPSQETAQVSVRAAADCNDWNRAVGRPFRWSREIKNGCGLFGRPGLKVGYSWAAERGSPCIMVKGFVRGRKKWFRAGCGRSGAIRNVPWGNVLAEKGIKVKGASLLKWR